MNVQENFESYLRERGIAEGLALFISEYSEFKEQQVSSEPPWQAISYAFHRNM